jgi:hypothetical protein
MARFNNALAASMLGIAQVAFLVGLPLIGRAFAGLALAEAVALAGFFAGFLFYQFKLNRSRLFGPQSPPSAASTTDRPRSR